MNITSDLETELSVYLAKAAPEARADIVALFKKWQADPRTALSRRDCMKEGCWGATTQLSKEQAGVLRTVLDGKRRLVTVDSYYQHLVARVIASHPIGAPAPKGTQTSTRFKPRRAGKNLEAGA
jgi:hypothetical protein